MVGSSGTREIRTSYPFTSGLIAGTTSQVGHEEYLKAETSLISDAEREGL